MNSILDCLQMVQTVDDDPKQHNKNPLFQQTSDQNSCSDQNQQNTQLKVSCSTKPSILLSSSHTHKQKKTITKNTSLSKKSANQQKKVEKRQIGTLSDGLRKLSATDQFSCQSCIYQLNLKCEICKGKKIMNGNDKIIKFFEYILEFKLGKQQSYRSKQQKLSNKRNHPNQHCNMYFSTINPKVYSEDKPGPKVRFSINNDVFRTDSIIESEQITNCHDFHNGFNCDQCETDPIKGFRYHCKQCQNFDLCEECFIRFGHRHDLEKMEPKGNKKSFEMINQLLRNNNSSSLRSSTRNSQSFKSSIVNKTCKSWIR